jgi:hypothetical protein
VTKECKKEEYTYKKGMNVNTVRNKFVCQCAWRMSRSYTSIRINNEVNEGGKERWKKECTLGRKK